MIRRFLTEAAAESGVQKFSSAFLQSEWEDLVDAWQLDGWEAYRDMKRLGRKTLGKRLRLGPNKPWLEIVGVTRDHRLHSLTEAPLPHFDLPALQHPYGSFVRLIARTKHDPMTVAPAVREEVLALNPEVTMEPPTTLEDEVKNSIAAARMASCSTSPARMRR